MVASQPNPSQAFACPARKERRQAERGAAVFIVVMVLTLLTGMGIFAVRSASLADQAAGYEREGAQAALIAQYGVTATAAYMATGVSGAILSRLEMSKTEVNPPICESNFLSATAQAAVPRPACYRLDMSDLQRSFTLSSSESVFAPANLPASSTIAGSTSSLNVNETTNATFVVEVTDAAKTGVPNAGSGTTSTPVRMTLTAIAQVRPAAACAAGASAPAAGQQAMRAMITAESMPQ